jgi:hypothetical protein
MYYYYYLGIGPQGERGVKTIVRVPQGTCLAAAATGSRTARPLTGPFNVLSQTGVRRHSELGWAQLENFCLSGAGGFNSAHTVASGQTYSTLMAGEKRSFFLASFL